MNDRGVTEHLSVAAPSHFALRRPRWSGNPVDGMFEAVRFFVGMQFTFLLFIAHISRLPVGRLV